MRFLCLATAPFLVVACSTSAPAPLPAEGETSVSSDAMSDAASYDGPTYEAGQFEHFEYVWYGTGVSEQYSVDRDCGISGQPYGSPAGPTRTGTMAEADCKGFADLAVSPETMSIMTGTTPCAFMVTEDYANLSSTYAGTEYRRMLGGCTDAPPFSHVKNELRRLYGLYAKSAPLDGGSDAAAD